jgi:hypothetical protein
MNSFYLNSFIYNTSFLNSSSLCLSKTFMKLSKGSNRRIDSFLHHAHRQLQSTNLSSKLMISNDIVNECVYICNQNFDHRNTFHCVALSDDDWMLWNFDDRKFDTTDISNYIPKFLDVFHVRVTKFSDQLFLKCDCLLYHRYV